MGQHRWRARLKYMFCTVCYVSGLVRLARWVNRNRTIILCYHGVTGRDRRNPADIHGLHVRSSRFERQLAYLKRRYRLIALSDYLEARRGGRAIGSYTAIVTFDDGYRNFFTLAAPVLVRESVPATMHVITGHLACGDDVDRQPSWTREDDTLFLSRNEVLYLRRLPGIDFGSHTRSHTRLDALGKADVAVELRSSFVTMREVVRDTTKSLTLAYPYGSSSAGIAKQACAAGYSCALTTDEGANDGTTPLFSLRRILIGDDDVLPIFATRVSGLLWPLKVWKTRARRVLIR